MKFTLNWLKDHLDTSASLEEITTKLTAIGLELEEVIDQAAALKPFIVARIEEAVQHPNAERLRVCKVNNGKEILQIVCGAPNARAGITVALASIGTVIPTNGLQIKQSKIRDVESCGMLCSATELGLGSDSDGIIELPDDATLGESIVGVLGLDDPVIDISLTPNRADCAGVRGIARDLAAADMGTLKALPKPEWQGQGASTVGVTIEDEGCRQFIGCTIRGVTNQPSPKWLQQRLKAIGLRPISMLVDITNYFSYDLGRPLHVYDVNRLQGGITVRRSNEGESFTALNDKDYTVSEGAIAICDQSGLIGLGGIIGGSSTGCELTTTDVFLEVAYFDPRRIAETGRLLQIDSDARFRFERGVDPAFLEESALLAVQMILDLCGGTASALIEVGTAPQWQRPIPFRPEFINKLGGTELAASTQQTILESLGFTVANGTATPPSWRGDVEGEADLAEEVLRIYGYDNIHTQLLPKLPVISGSILTPMQQRTRQIRATLAARGMVECKTWSFMAEEPAKLFGHSNPALKLMNPISSELDTMRPSILPNLLQAARNNSDRGSADLQLFEIGLQFKDTSPNGQQLVAAALRCGSTAPRNPFGTHRAADCHDAKADAITMIEACGFDAAQLQIVAEAPAWYHPGRSGAFKLGKQVIGYFGELHPAVLKTLDAPARSVAVELFVAAIPLAKRKSATKPALQASAYQAVQRDFAFVVDSTLPANDLLRAVQASDKTLVRQVQLFDVYEGQHVESGKKSVALSITLQADDRTLTEADIEAIHRKVLENAAKIGAKLRA